MILALRALLTFDLGRGRLTPFTFPPFLQFAVMWVFYYVNHLMAARKDVQGGRIPLFVSPGVLEHEQVARFIADIDLSISYTLLGILSGLHSGEPPPTSWRHAHDTEQAAVALAVMRVFESHISLALLYGLQSWHPEGVLAKPDMPFRSTPLQFCLPHTGTLQVTRELGEADFIDLHKVPSESVKCPAVPDSEQVLDPVAIIAKDLESHQPLVAGALVEMPNFMAVEPCVLTADLAPVPGAFIGRPPDSVPLPPGQ